MLSFLYFIDRSFLVANNQPNSCHIIFCSDGFCKMTGFTRAEVTHERLFSSQKKRDRKIIVCQTTLTFFQFSFSCSNEIRLCNEVLYVTSSSGMISVFSLSVVLYFTHSSPIYFLSNARYQFSALIKSKGLK